MRGRDGNVHRGRPQGRLSADDQPSRRDDFRRERRVVRAPHERHHRHASARPASATARLPPARFTKRFNQAAVEKLPLVLVVANNQYAYSTPTSRQFACAIFADKAVGYGVESHSVDGTDLAACLEASSATPSPAPAPAAARNWSSPRLLRLCGHGEHDDASYIDPKLKNSPIGRDCLKVAEEFLLQQKWADAAQLAVWRSEAVRESRRSRRQGAARTRARSVRGKLVRAVVRTSERRHE